MRLSMASALAVAVGPLQVVVDPVLRPWRSIRIRIRCALEIKDSPLVLFVALPVDVLPRRESRPKCCVLVLVI